MIRSLQRFSASISAPPFSQRCNCFIIGQHGDAATCHLTTSHAEDYFGELDFVISLRLNVLFWCFIKVLCGTKQNGKFEGISTIINKVIECESFVFYVNWLHSTTCMASSRCKVGSSEQKELNILFLPFFNFFLLFVYQHQLVEADTHMSMYVVADSAQFK